MKATETALEEEEEESDEEEEEEEESDEEEEEEPRTEAESEKDKEENVKESGARFEPDLPWAKTLKSKAKKAAPLPPLSFPLEHSYSKASFLGRGVYGEVYTYRRSDSWAGSGSLGGAPEEVAVKKVTKEGFSYREEDILMQMNHRNIVKFYGRVDKPDDRKNRPIWLVMELCDCSLSDLIKTGRDLRWAPVSCLVRQIARALEYMHGNKIIHRDLKPANILLKHTNAGGAAADGKLDLPAVDVAHGLTVKVTDFGFSRRLHLESFTMTQLGTLLYMAPEVTSKEGRYGNKADLYSLGVIAYELATLQTATLETDREKCWSSQDFSPDFKDALDKMLFMDPAERISAKELLAHPFLAEQD